MKTFEFNIQSKGGAGKSMLTYLQALKHEQDPDALFVDLDSSTKTSVKQLRFIGLKKRVIEVDMLDRIRKIEQLLPQSKKLTIEGKDLNEQLIGSANKKNRKVRLHLVGYEC